MKKFTLIPKNEILRYKSKQNEQNLYEEKYKTLMKKYQRIK